MTVTGSTEVKIGGQRLWRSGSGQAVILIHGVGMDLTMWDSIARRLEQKFTVIRYDMIGHGPVPQPAPPYSLSMYVEQLSRVLAANEIDTAGIFGFSMGSLVAQGFALAYPDKTDWLVCLNGVYNRTNSERAAVLKRVADSLIQGPEAGVDAAIDRWFTPKFREKNPAIIGAVRRRILSNDRVAYSGAYQVFGTADAELFGKLQNISCPTLSMTGESDQRSTPAMARALADAVQNGKCVILPGQRHLTPFEVPDDICAHLDDFLGRRSSAV